jgi:hypothetical protein
VTELARDIRTWAAGALLAAELATDDADRAAFERLAEEMVAAAVELEQAEP